MSQVTTLQKKIYQQNLFKIEDQNHFKDCMHRSIGGMHFLTSNKKTCVGTGVLISKDLLLTAAHNIYNNILQTENTEFRFYLGSNGVEYNYNQFQQWRYHPNFRLKGSNRKIEYDYALVKLKQPVLLDKYLELQYPCEQCLISFNQYTELHIYGYPGLPGNYSPQDKSGDIIKLHQYGLSRKNRIITISHKDSKIGYAITTQPGQSGSPIIIENKIIGTHVGGGNQTQQYNIGRIISTDMIKNLEKWCFEMNGTPFTLNSKGLCEHIEPLIAVKKQQNNFMKFNQTPSPKKVYKIIKKNYQPLTNDKQKDLQTARKLWIEAIRPYKKGEYGESLAPLQFSAKIYEYYKVKSRKSGDAQWYLGCNYLFIQEYQKAAQAFQKCIPLCRQFKMPYSLTTSIQRLARCYKALNKFQELSNLINENNLDPIQL